jgi:hypothetical protein
MRVNIDMDQSDVRALRSLTTEVAETKMMIGLSKTVFVAFPGCVAQLSTATQLEAFHSVAGARPPKFCA